MQTLARYAAICQDEGVAPIVEPEVLMDGGDHLARCAEVTEAVLHAVFDALHRHRVVLEHMLLKPSMVVAGKEQAQQAPVAEVATGTVRVLRRCVPAAVPGVFFLSGGQTAEEVRVTNAPPPHAPHTAPRAPAHPPCSTRAPSAATASSRCSSFVAPTIGAVTPLLPSTQASATCARGTPSRPATLRTASTTLRSASPVSA